MGKIERKPISLTYVLHEKGDFLGMILALSSLCPIFLIVAYTSVILARRELIIIFTLIGQLLNELFNTIIKHIIKQPRPENAALTSYGMPSSHSQFMFFFATYCILYMFLKLKMNNNLWKFLISVGLIIVASTVAYSRYYLSYHSAQQVIVGITLGIFAGACWFFIVDCYIRPHWFRQILEHPISRFFLLQDSENIDNVFVWEYEQRMKYYFNQQKEK
ncbi:PAP2-domain-containing protein [Neocallimastix lanati (nom. inval.)]|jgi:dolichyldiphosphatase|uniref:Dolichyldiphosphatase n=1 Tax=Neocallimastix californiae TaxID=1754190 RepID=A0A1Y2F5J7_9FUNG|nr:PAP2-domain-containing protein [Neocallimastix sp. JGI-2020a]ORY79162.1 PAP2-domain-containing protein [Neocallimastix californiae]|eukprot:ORY79162.1 PAP2-domain-containing protein [Neocallimastix californiae]